VPFHAETSSSHSPLGDDPFTAGDELLDRAREVAKRIEETVRKLAPEVAHAGPTDEPPGLMAFPSRS
jgi:hypothetical protein